MLPHHSAPEVPADPAALHLVEEISHRVVNEFSEAIAMISLAARAQDGAGRAALEQAAERLRAHAHGHRALLPPKTRQLLDLAEHLERVCGAMALAFIADNGARLLLRADNVLLPADRCWRIGLIVAELVRNAARHGLSGGDGLIVVRILADPGKLRCIVCDNGNAAPKSSTGLGQGLVRRLAGDLGGEVQWRFTDHGCTVEAEFPDADSEISLPRVCATLGSA
jgi:two-component sensor histidine kinase